MRRLLFALLIAGCARQDGVQVSAAASLQDVLQEIGGNYQRRTGDHVSMTFAASGILARQIQAGAPIDVFFSADEATMDRIGDRIAVRKDILSNELAVVSTRAVPDLRTVQRLALGNPDTVPSGAYARQYFQTQGMWEAIRPKVIPMENVRAALAAADNGSIDAAIVYRTDALLAKRARVVMALPGPVIRYPVAVLRDAKHPDAARRFVDYLQSADAAAVFRKFGFATLR